MTSTATDTPPPSANGTDHLVRPRPSKLHHSQLLRTVSSGDVISDNGTITGMTSGRSTPVPPDAPPSVKALSSSRKQVRAEQRRRIFPTIEYASRVSHFDPNSDYKDFHGFFNLFWIGLAIMAITTMLRNIKDTGYPLQVQIWSLFTVKVRELAVADFLMVASTAISLPLQKLFRAAPASGILTWSLGGMAIQSIYQVAWISLWVFLPFYLEWTWTAQVFLLIHTMVLLMKMHSYAFYNGHLSETEKRLRALDHPETASRAPAYVYPSTEDPTQDDASASGVAIKGGAMKKRPSKGTRATPTARKESGSSNGAHTPRAHTPPITPITDDEDGLGTLREDLARELTSPMGNTVYPRNLTWANYFDYLLCPTLCYELEYPRVPKINWTSLISKIVATFGCIFLLTITSEEFIYPVLLDAQSRLDGGAGYMSNYNTNLHGHNGTFLSPTPPPSSDFASTTVTRVPTSMEALLVLAEAVSWMLFPFMLTFLLVFLVIFEYILGAFAEITRFGDRHFYSDWWNSTDWMEFSREWNVPVHSFLRRHVYGASRPHVGRAMATVMTFLVSAAGHEVVMACITKKIRGYGFVCQMLQLPIVVLQRTKWVRGKETLNNVCFWCSMIMGLSMICSLYVLV